MGKRVVNARLKGQAISNIEKWGWDRVNEDPNLGKAYRYIFSIPEHVPNSQIERWVRESQKREGIKI